MPYRDTRRARQALQELAVSQGGYVTSQQALSVGYDRRHLAYHVRAGNVVRAGWGLYRIPALPFSEHDDLIRWCLWSRDRSGIPQAAVGHESALAVHGLGDTLPSAVHLVVPSGFRKPEPNGCRLHRASPGDGEVEDREGFRVTTPIRTLLDLAIRPGFPTRALRQAVAEAVERGRVRATVLRSRARELGLEHRMGLSPKGSRKKKP